MIRILLILALAAGGYYFFGSEKHYAPGMLITEVPQQVTVSKASFIHHGITVQPVAAFELSARVLGTKRYDDAQSQLAPIDFALGWREMSDQSVLDQMRISQVYRFWQWHTKGSSWPVPRERIEQNGSNMHLIPATEAVWKQLKAVDRSEVVHLQGYLVNSRWPNGRVWNSSTTRDDVGDGACELFWVESVRVQP